MGVWSTLLYRSVDWPPVEIYSHQATLCTREGCLIWKSHLLTTREALKRLEIEAACQLGPARGSFSADWEKRSYTRGYEQYNKVISAKKPNRSGQVKSALLLAAFSKNISVETKISWCYGGTATILTVGQSSKDQKESCILELFKRVPRILRRLDEID